MINWSKVIEEINNLTNSDDTYLESSSVSGGDINSSYKLTTHSNQQYFIKVNNISLMDMFIAEFEGLNELQKCKEIITPRPICYGQQENYSFIVMEYLSLNSIGDSYNLGKNLAKMHKISQTQFGWKINNTIGSTAQSNQLCDNWVDFWKNERLIPQFKLLYSKGYKGQLKNKADYLLASIEDFFQGYQPIASLLHGDLWSGNAAFDNSFNNKGNGVIFDPALYYGDRETDLAMTELFGGFSQDFYTGYQEEFALADSYKKRKPMYNLYHTLNHANLFGGSYVSQVISSMERLLI
jgi:protein-ribulosamine 3-kinase